MALLILGVVLFNLLDEEEYVEEEVKILGSNTNIGWINIENSYGEYKITKQDSDYAIDGLEEGMINTGLADNLFYALIGLESLAVCEKEENFMGLESPNAVVTLGVGEGQTTLKVGRKSEKYDGYYIAYDNAVYIIECYTAELFFTSPDEYRDNHFFSFEYESDYDKLTYVSIDGPDIIPMEFEKKNEDLYMVSPVHHLCSQRDLRQELLDSLMHMTGDEYVGSVETGEMGFDNSEFTIKIEYDGQIYDLIVGNVLGQRRYVTVKGSGAIYLVDVSKLEFLNIDYRKAIGVNIYYRSIDDVNAFSIEYNGQLFDFDIENTPQGLVIRHNGVEYSKDEVLPIYNKIIGLNMFKILDENASLTNEIVIKLVLKNGFTDTVMLSKINDREYGVNVNGDYVFSTTAVIVEEMLDKLSQY